jgi:rod shape-determining protein MreC
VAPVLSARRPEILLLVLLSACLALLSLQVRRPGGETAGERFLLDTAAPFVRLVAGVRAGGSQVAEWSASRSRLQEKNRLLTERVAALEEEIFRFRDAQQDKQRLLALLGSYPETPSGTQAARLVAVPSGSTFRSALLDRGSLDHIRPQGVVVGPTGLLGRIVAVAPHTARVQLLSDRTAAVGILLPREGRAAVLHGDEEGRGLVSVLYVPRSAAGEVRAGDEVRTSGTDGVYPKGLLVGTISEVRKEKPLFLDLSVRLAADPATESMVFVLPPVLPPQQGVASLPGKP